MSKRFAWAKPRLQAAHHETRLRANAQLAGFPYAKDADFPARRAAWDESRQRLRRIERLLRACKTGVLAGHCFRMAGFVEATPRLTKDGKLVLQLLPDDMPPPLPPRGFQCRLEMDHE